MRPLAGIGVGLRSEFVAEIQETKRRVDWLEIIPETWHSVGGRPRKNLLACLERWTIVPHSTALSIGGPEPFDEEYLEAMAKMCKILDPPFFSDHICYAYINGAHTHELLPLPFSREAVDHVVRRIGQVRDRFGVPLVLENPSFYAKMPGGDLDEATFLATLVEEGDIGMLLDVNNVFVNSKNHAYDPYQFIDRMPLDRVRQIHLAGHSRRGEIIIDTHQGPIIDDVWALYQHTIARAQRLIPTLIEWDTEIPPLDQVLDEVDRAYACVERALPSAAAPAAVGA